MSIARAWAAAAVAALSLTFGAGCSESKAVKESQELADKACACKDAECYHAAVEEYARWATSNKESSISKADYDKIETNHKRVLSCAKSIPDATR